MLKVQLKPSNMLSQHIFYSTTSNVSKKVKIDKVARNIINEVSTKQKLYMTDPISPGSVFFLPNGTKIFNKLINFMKLQQEFKFGFKEVITPIIYRKSLWERSGHWENYKDDMFKVESRDESKEEYGLKPMNCPGHCIIFKETDRSYTELPLRFSDFSPLHRNEASGALSGLTRVRKFHQDDGHIFCTPEQVKDEIKKCLKMIDMCYTKVFSINKNLNSAYSMELSTRPEHYIGDIKVWDHAEDVLKSILNNSGKKWELNEGDGAFYGPKIDIKVTDQNNKSHQVATIQLDFQLPERFELRYKDKDNTYKRPIMIHRAAFGSLERFIAMLIDTNEGKWPFWLNPYQAIIIPVNTKSQEQVKACEDLQIQLKGELRDIDDLTPIRSNGFHFNAYTDLRSESISYRIKDAIKKNYSYLIIVGDKEIETGRFAVRTRADRTLNHLTSKEIINTFIDLEANYK